MCDSPFDKLPDEVILHTFIKGVEDEPDSIFFSSCSRRLKTFAHLARQVCARWKVIIDNSLSNVSFWIACLVLRTDERRLDNPYPPSFAKRLTKFFRQLLASKGCDLAVKFYLPTLSVASEMANGMLSSHTSTLIRLVIHAMDMVTPYHSQVIKLHLDIDGLEILSHLLRLVATRWAKAKHLFSVTFSPRSYMDSRLRVLTGFDLSSLLGYDKIQTKASIQASQRMPLTLAHLHNLDTLTLPSGLWIEQGLVLPPDLHHLELLAAEDDTLHRLYCVLRTQIISQSCKGLRSISIERAVNNEPVIGTSGEQKRVKLPCGQSLDRTRLPLLHITTLKGFLEEDIRDFLGLLFCPSLEVLSLHLIEPPLPKEEWRSQTPLENLLMADWFQTPGDSDRPSTPDLSTTQFASECSRLSVLKLEILFSWRSLYCLKMLTGLPIKTLSISISHYDHDWAGYLKERFSSALSSLDFRNLHHLTLKGSYWFIRYILASMDTRKLTTLKVQPEYVWNTVNEPMPPRDQRTVSVPRLRTLSFNGTEDDLTHLLSQLETEQLVTFEADIKEYNPVSNTIGDWDQEKTLQALSTRSFPLVRVARYTFSQCEQCTHHWNLFPDIEKLQIKMLIEPMGFQRGLRRGLWTSGEGEATSVCDVIQSVCNDLTPIDAGIVSFPDLHSMDVSCGIIEYSDKLPSRLSEDAKAEAIRIVQEMLAKRREAGGLTLQMTPLRSAYGYERGGEVLTVAFEALATSPLSV